VPLQAWLVREAVLWCWCPAVAARALGAGGAGCSDGRRRRGCVRAGGGWRRGSATCSVD